MKILLINNNPVVSRLTALSARKEDIEIDEIQEVTELNSDTYDIVFVDADSWSKDVRDVISENIKMKKSVLFYAEGDEEDRSSFDISILKPFLPSEVSAVIRSVEEEVLSSSPIVEGEEEQFSILDERDKKSSEELFDLDEMERSNSLNGEDSEKKVEVEKLSFDEKLEEAFPLNKSDLDEELFDNSKIELSLEDEAKVEDHGREKSELFELDLEDQIPSLEEDLFSEDKEEEKSREKSLKPSKVDSSDIEAEKRETKVLDEAEIENIKGILTEDISDDITLEELMSPIPVTSMSQESDLQVEEHKGVEAADSNSKEIVQTLSTMPIEGLRELLAGAKVNIKIKFPKSKK